MLNLVKALQGSPMQQRPFNLGFRKDPKGVPTPPSEHLLPFPLPEPSRASCLAVGMQGASTPGPPQPPEQTFLLGLANTFLNSEFHPA